MSQRNLPTAPHTSQRLSFWTGVLAARSERTRPLAHVQRASRAPRPWAQQGRRHTPVFLQGPAQQAPEKPASNSPRTDGAPRSLGEPAEQLKGHLGERPQHSRHCCPETARPASGERQGSAPNAPTLGGRAVRRGGGRAPPTVGADPTHKSRPREEDA